MVASVAGSLTCDGVHLRVSGEGLLQPAVIGLALYGLYVGILVRSHLLMHILSCEVLSLPAGHIGVTCRVSVCRSGLCRAMTSLKESGVRCRTEERTTYGMSCSCRASSCLAWNTKLVFAVPLPSCTAAVVLLRHCCMLRTLVNHAHAFPVFLCRRDRLAAQASIVEMTRSQETNHTLLLTMPRAFLSLRSAKMTIPEMPSRLPSCSAANGEYQRCAMAVAALPPGKHCTNTHPRSAYEITFTSSG